MSARRALVTGVGGQEAPSSPGFSSTTATTSGGSSAGTPAPTWTTSAGSPPAIELVEADARSRLARRSAPRHPAGRGLQPRGAVVRPALLGRADPDGRVCRRRADVDAGGDPRGRSGDPLLPGLLERDLRRAAQTPQTEETAPSPLTPYGVAKTYAHFGGDYRRRYGMFTCCGILYNHESPLRPVDFLPRKVARAAAAISLGLERELVLGDLSARRDGGMPATTSAQCG